MKTGIFVMCLIVPVILLVTGCISKARPKKDINSVIGYRSRRSRSSQEMWDKAQLLMAKYLIIIGAALLVISIAAGVFIASIADMNTMIIGVSILSCVQVAAIILIIPLVESKLK